MIKIFTNVWPNKYLRTRQEFSEEFVNKLITHTNVETTDAFDSNDGVSLMLLDQADEMQEFMQLHNLNGRIGLIYNLSHAYPWWSLVVDADSGRGSINLLVSKFFRWDRAESQSILSFDEIMKM